MEIALVNFDQSKRVRFADIVYVEGVEREQPDRLTGIDESGVHISFDRAAIERGDALLLHEVESEFGVFDDDGYYEGDADEYEVIGEAAVTAVYAVTDENDPREGFAYNIDFENGLVYVDRNGVAERMPIDEFKTRAWRCEENGTLVASFASHSPETQYSMCKERGLTAHMEELDAVFAQMKLADATWDQMRGFWHDIHKLPGEGETFEEIYERVYLQNRTPLHERFSLNERTDNAWQNIVPAEVRLGEEEDYMLTEPAPAPQWGRAIDNPLFKSPQIRQALTFFLKERIGDFPVEEMAYAGFPDLETADAVLSQAFSKRKVCEPFTGGHMMPGYKTTDVLEFNANGLTVIAFTDMGKLGYAYAYPTRRAINLLPAPDASAAPKI
jgi:hypothetical protein